MNETLNSQLSILNFFRFPEECRLGKRVFKKLFHENAKLGATDRKAFREDIDVITWAYTLKPITIPIRAYEDDLREYHEVAILQVNLMAINRTKRIAEIIHRAIPYPLIVEFRVENEELRVKGKNKPTLNSELSTHHSLLSLAHKRFSQVEKGAIVAEDLILTKWIDLAAPTPVQRSFLDSLSLSKLPHTHFFAFYAALMDRLVALDCARLTGEYRLETKATQRKVRTDRLAVCHELENQIAGHKAAIKKETQFNRKVELNMKLKELEKELALSIEELG